MDEDGRALIDWLRGHDEPCPACGYNLRGAPGALCPECGSAIALGIRSPGLRIGPWIFAVVSFSLALGFDAVMAVILLIAAVASPPIGSDWAVFGTLFGSFFVLGGLSGAGLGWILVRQRRWRTGSRSGHWAVAWAVFLVVGAIHAAAGSWLIFGVV